MVNEPSMLELLRFDCISFVQNGKQSTKCIQSTRYVNIYGKYGVWHTLKTITFVTAMNTQNI